MECLDACDAIAIELFCEAYSEWRVCLAEIDKHGRVYEGKRRDGSVLLKAHPAVFQAQDAWRRTRSMLSEFGFTPASRTKLGSILQDDDELGKILLMYDARGN